MKPKIHMYHQDLPDHITFHESVAIDTEAMGLNIGRDRLCLVQLSDGNGECHLVHIPAERPLHAPNLKRILTNPNILKLFHFARFDVRILNETFALQVQPFYCTKIVSKLVRTYTDKHSLKELLKQLLGVEISKQEQTSDWGAEVLRPEQQFYAAMDVFHLHRLKEELDKMLLREQKAALAYAAFEALQTLINLESAGYNPQELFSH